MRALTFKTLSFLDKGDVILVNLLRQFSTEIPRVELESISKFYITGPNTIEFEKDEKSETRFSFLLDKHLINLRTKITGNNATYIHRNSDIPLIGNVAFGIVYRGSSIIEIKTNTVCNLDCVYCSISEGLSSRKNDFVIEKDYLVDELLNLIYFVAEPVEVHIGVQGEPFLYADMEELISDIQEMEKVHTISIDSNGSLLSKEKLVRLAENSKLQLNLSLDAIDEDTAKKIAGVKTYNVNHIKEIIATACELGIKVIIAPVFTSGYNHDQMEKIVQWVQSLPNQPIIGIQNFLRYKTGRNPGKEVSWEEFYSLLDGLEKKYNIKLKLGKDDFKIRKTKELPKPFEEGDVVDATIKCMDRFPGGVIAVAKGRSISVPNCDFKLDRKIKLKVMRDKHNIFVGKMVSH